VAEFLGEEWLWIVPDASILLASSNIGDGGAIVDNCSILAESSVMSAHINSFTWSNWASIVAGGMDQYNCNMGSQCKWSNGAGLYSDKGFCAIRSMTTDVNTIMSCNGLQGDQCSGECQWYEGKVVASNMDSSQGKPIFKWNFCHPPVTSGWSQNAPSCLYKNSQSSCESSTSSSMGVNCVWSTGQELVPKGAGEFCSIRTISDQA
jgi:hypothetical protein